MLQFSALSSFSEWQENVGRESSNFSRVTVFAFNGDQLFLVWLLVAG